MQSWQHVCITSSGSPRMFERVINQSSTLCRRYVGNPQKRLWRLSQVRATGDFCGTKYLALVSCAYTTWSMKELPADFSFDHPQLIKDVTNCGMTVLNSLSAAKSGAAMSMSVSEIAPQSNRLTYLQCLSRRNYIWHCLLFLSHRLPTNPIYNQHLLVIILTTLSHHRDFT